MFHKKPDDSSATKLVFVTGPYVHKCISLQAERALIIGRDREVDLPLDDETLSRRHCVITFEDGRSYVDDLGSVNGTFVNGERISKKTELLEFDRLFFGSTEMELRCD
jgi:pSer/pThr/pTyr-binding forkhead associated (FHA) protein